MPVESPGYSRCTVGAVAIFGAVGSGKTSACMNPFARQLFGWQAANPERRAAGLVLEVKGDFCDDIREILKKAGRGVGSRIPVRIPILSRVPERLSSATNRNCLKSTRWA